MTYLWTPWRSTYMKAKKEQSRCIFCVAAAEPERDEENLVVFRGSSVFAILNRYPYTSGHLMIAPYEHIARLASATEETGAEMMRLTRRAEVILQRAYQPDGLNLGMNLGRAAGAGIEEHIHMHVLPRWSGDANFMTSVGNARLIPEALEETYAKLRDGFSARQSEA
ncbi:MAG: HIT domain-containing protein [Acidobacteriaceae bacterium]|nr:HIT domain-containing protein [Acidobacteriaceae bacterium]